MVYERGDVFGVHYRNMNRSGAAPRQVRRILVLTKYRFIGDTLLAVPAIRATAQAWPDAAITLVTGSRALELLQNCPYVSETIEFDPYQPSDQGVRRYLQIVGKLRERHFDLALILNRSFQSALTAFLAGAKLRAGWAGFQGRDFLLQRKAVYDEKACEIECHYNVLASVLDLAPDSVTLDRRPALWLTPAETSQPPHPVLARPRVVGIQPGATHPYKRWPAQRYAQLIGELIAGGQAGQVVLLGGPDEIAQAEETVRLVSAPARARLTNLVGQFTLRQTLSALGRLSLFIGNDTGIRHCAVALDTPSIAIFGPTGIAKWGNPNPPRHLALCAPSESVGDITLDEVLAAASGVIRASTGKREPALAS